MSNVARAKQPLSRDFLAGARRMAGFRGEWPRTRIAHFADCTSGGTPDTSIPEYWGGTIPWMNSGDLHKKVVTEVEGRITKRGLSESSAKLLPPRCVLIGLAGQGRTRGTVAFNTLELATNQSIAAILPSSEVVPEYLYHNLDARYDELRAKSTGEGGRGALNLRILKEIEVPLPPIKEQTFIANVLFDLDDAIKALERHLAKTRAIKLGTMQQLLTGRTRLPGFSHTEKWTTRRLGRHVRFLRQGTNSRSDLTSDGPVKYLHYGDVHSSSCMFLGPDLQALLSLPSDGNSSLDRLEDGDLVIVDASEDLEGVGKSVEVKGLGAQALVAGLHTIAVRFDKTVLVDGFKAYLQFVPVFRRHLRRLAAGTKVYATKRSDIASAELPLPAPGEQRAIATVLFDMEHEIAALENRIEKTRAIKEGLMQALLTGRVRVPLALETPEEDDARDV